MYARGLALEKVVALPAHLELCALCRWIVFGTPETMPWSFGSVVSSGSDGCRCKCEEIQNCIVGGKAPIAPSTGLASQHNCGKNIASLNKWHQVRRVPKFVPGEKL